MQVVLHIGNEKTGTTSLQEFFTSKFNDRKGSIYYPLAGRGAVKSHRRLYEDLAAGHSKEVERYILTEIEAVSANTLLFSEEVFSSQSPQSERALAEFRAIARSNGWSVHLVTVVRKAHPFLRSLYMEGLNWGRTDDFDMFVRRHLKRLRAELLEDTAIEFGWTSSFLRYEPHELLDNILKEINDTLTTENEILSRSNVSVPQWMAPFLLKANRTFRDHKLTQRLRNIVTEANPTPPPTYDAETELFFRLSGAMEEAVKEIEQTDRVRARLWQSI